MNKLDLIVLLATVLVLSINILTVDAGRVKRQLSPFSSYISPAKKFVRNRPQPPEAAEDFSPTSIEETRRLQSLPPAFEPKEPSRSRDFYICLTSCLTLSHYNPVCGTDHTTYHNVYKLDCANRCGAKPKVQVRKPGIC
ncbi:uncharacterized protein LOC131438219 [Malaya genurostris]|uniref:uncharacterized protein LOC131438219 n=1 Tax=Malaya genurostris TaxID=325434 RepID=UPI0026F3DFF5|nr:uncharacterized protein LOC131438219 [Malaya genurostris]